MGGCVKNAVRMILDASSMKTVILVVESTAVKSGCVR